MLTEKRRLSLAVVCRRQVFCIPQVFIAQQVFYIHKVQANESHRAYRVHLTRQHCHHMALNYDLGVYFEAARRHGALPPLGRTTWF